MAVITSVENLDVYTSPTNPCQNFAIDLRVVNDITDVNLFQFNFYINKGTPQQQLIQFDAGDIVGTVGDLKTFEKSIDVNRRTFYPWQYTIDTTTGVNVYDEPTSTLFPGSWDIESVNVSTDINDVGTVSVITTPVLGLSAFLGIEISIDDITYFDTNVITGLAAGDYTLYVRDIFGCQRTTPFTVSTETAFESLNDFKFVSLLNPVPFVEINSNRPSFSNTPSYLVDTNSLSRNRKYEYLNTDSDLRFQFRSNFETNLAYLISCGEVIQTLDVTKKSDNLNQRDNRDAKFYFENGFLFAYYDGTGSIYDNDGNVIGNNELNGTLLFDQIQGELLSINSLGVIEILEILTVDGIGQVMKLNFTQPIAQDYLKITTYYNAENFEVYEFDLTLAQNLADYQLIILNKPISFTPDNVIQEASFISEVITITDEFTQPNFKLVWKNSENNQMSWDTGIECYNYLPKQIEPIYEPQDENEIYTTDTTKFMLESEVYDVFTFVFDVVSQITARQIALIASSDYLKIDDNFYVKEETPEIEANIGSNTYMVSLKLTLASNYNSNEREGLTRNADTVSTDGFLKII